MDGNARVSIESIQRQRSLLYLRRPKPGTSGDEERSLRTREWSCVRDQCERYIVRHQLRHPYVFGAPDIRTYLEQRLS